MTKGFLIRIFVYNECVFTHKGLYSNCHYAYRSAMHYAKNYPNRTHVLVTEL